MIENIELPLQKCKPENKYEKYKKLYKASEIGKVRTRFNPEPAGYLTMAHLKSAILNYQYSKMYKGEMVLRFNDVRPNKQKKYQTKFVLEDLEALGIRYTQLTYVSDYYEKIIKCCRQLIENNLAYADNTDNQTFRAQRTNQIQSAFRNLPVQKNLQIFQKMLKGENQQFYLRAKINMQGRNQSLRDPVICRTDRTPHSRTGRKYNVYPTYSFATPIIDQVEGISYVFRTGQFIDQTAFYHWVQRVLGFNQIQIYEFSKISLEYMSLNENHLRWFVENKVVDGWDDPRIPTIRGVIRKGVTVEALTLFALQSSPSRNTRVMGWEQLWAYNKSFIDPISERYSAVRVKNSSTLVIKNIHEPQVITVKQHRLSSIQSERPLWIGNNILLNFEDAVLLEIGEKVTLLKWGNIQIKSKTLQADRSYALTAQYLAEDRDFKKTKKISWLAADSNLLVAEVVQYQPLLNTRTVEETNLQTTINPNSRISQKYYVDSCLRLLNVGSYVQFERMGYYKIDFISMENNDLFYRLIYVPDGREPKYVPPEPTNKNIASK